MIAALLCYASSHKKAMCIKELENEKRTGVRGNCRESGISQQRNRVSRGRGQKGYCKKYYRRTEDSFFCE